MLSFAFQGRKGGKKESAPTCQAFCHRSSEPIPNILTALLREKISTQHLLVKHDFLQRLEGVVMPVVNWGQGIVMYHMPTTSVSTPFQPFLRKLCIHLIRPMFTVVPIINMHYSRVFMCGPKRKIIPGISNIRPGLPPHPYTLPTKNTAV